VWVQCPPSGCGNSPIIIDTTGKGFKFTDPNKEREYVTFDLHGDGTYEHLSWPRHGSGNAWLIYDVNDDGIITSGKELFGNFTAHSDGGVQGHPNPNGFLALEWYDRPEQGGNMDLIIDKRDAAWKKLKLWIDEHCYLSPDLPCSSLPREIHSLESAGIHSLSLVYDSSPKVDAVGNQFKFFAVVNPEVHDKPKDEKGHVCCDAHQRSQDGRLMFDIFLKTQAQ